MFKPNKYQQAVFDFIKKGKGNAIVSAVAGSGKTSTIIEALKIIPSEQRKIFLAFNKSIVEELKQRTSGIPNVTVRTLHSAGYSAMLSNYAARLDNYKYRRELNNNVECFSKEINSHTKTTVKEEYKSTVIKLLGLARASLVSDKESISKLASEHDIEINYDEDDVVPILMKWGLSNPSVMDYCDMIWIPVVNKLSLRKYDWVLVDECQDLSPMQRELFQMMIEPKGGRFIAVGDRKQSIQFFAGAGNDSFDRILKLPHTKEFPLSVCYRCDRKIIEEAKKLVPQIEARKDAPDGIFEHRDNIPVLKKGDMIISRKNSPLTSLVMKLLSSGIKAYIKGKDVGRNLIDMIKKTKENNIPLMIMDLQANLDKLQLKLVDKNGISMGEAKKDSQYINQEDKIACIRNLSKGEESSTSLIDKIDNLFKEESDGICLSSIHKSKGLEAERVFIVDPNNLPLKKAMNNPIQAQQEKNLEYVAYTRPKHALYIIDTPVNEIEIDKESSETVNADDKKEDTEVIENKKDTHINISDRKKELLEILRTGKFMWKPVSEESFDYPDKYIYKEFNKKYGDLRGFKISYRQKGKLRFSMKNYEFTTSLTLFPVMGKNGKKETDYYTYFIEK